ncbi:MAG: PDC sensor domain-containing protein [Gammaproteobacteria bacterium]|nr:PDC sensor domain-containing protein [Gammaproteobacteria bacterium]MCW8840312.1 PDC sensor domain-containing protein [Gammaproteobacteria bacterium]MCW8927558.1 PDC sensor domain-containing protein [Gammaproteobacteria bacterium]MCW8958072.1 PDC sensor domain-containing protein [Gammaproteobacteria bacterium]MCW8973897.1 PDC sensor domain-containing protein [Gammaproteobacteria bacterium]
MSVNKGSLQESIANQREELIAMMKAPLQQVAQASVRVWHERERLEALLQESLAVIPYCKFLYALNPHGVQISSNISHEGLIEKDFGRDRSQRPYMQQIKVGTNFMLSEAYISMRARRPSLTALTTVIDEENNLLGYLGADFDLRDLPLTRELYDEPTSWRQIKGDPAIRVSVFHQTRSDSRMDKHIDEVLGVVEELILEHGIFHAKLHFSSSRATIWLVDDPYRYRLMDIDMLNDPDICLAYPRRPYPEGAVVPANRIRDVLDGLRELRYMDEMFYLRAGAVNIFNGMVSLTFSCDGSHYLPWDEFLNKEHAFWTSHLTTN